jgi:predicted secreted hydrolase
MRRFASFAIILTLCASYGMAQWKPALPGYSFEFPRDHGSHAGYQTEWWYYTGHLRSEAGREYGFEVTFFRVGVEATEGEKANAWDLRDLSLAHFAITDIGRKQFRYFEKLNRSSKFTADAAPGALRVFNESWSVVALPSGAWRLRADGGGDQIDLTLTSRKAPAVHGENGISVKAAGVGYASHYYSMTRLEVTGELRTAGRRERCSGLAWMDHEFGSSALRETQQGWDWFSIQLDNDTELMLYLIRRRDGTPDITSAGSLILSDGRVIHLRREQFRVSSSGHWRSSRSGASYPMGWRIVVPAYALDLELREVLRDQELVTKGSTQVTYWEGAVNVNGRFGSSSTSGVGYVEMTGYDKPFRQP